MKDPSGKSSNHQGVIYIGIAASVLAAGALWYAFSIRSSRSSRNQYRDVDTTDDLDDTITTSTSATASTSGTRNQRDSATNNKYLEPEPTLSSVSQPSTPATPVASNVDNKNKNAKKSPTKTDKTKTTYTTDASSEAQKEVEAADKRGKVLFKAKKYMEAAECFTEALNIISTSSSSKSAEKAAAPAASTTSTSNVFDPNKSSMGKQYITVLNNRSAMYEKADLHELALADCDEILSTADANHDKARLRKLRIMEHMGRYRDALVEVCAVQLK